MNCSLNDHLSSNRTKHKKGITESLPRSGKMTWQDRTIVVVLGAFSPAAVLGVDAGASVHKGLGPREVIARYNARDLGRTGFREIILRTSAGSGNSYEYRIVHYWASEKDRCTSAFVVLQPEFMAGTSCLIREERGACGRPPKVFLYLPSSTQVMAIDFSRLDECVVGSDFSYRDLMFWIDAGTFHLKSLHQGEAKNGGLQIVSALATTSRSTGAIWPRRIYYIDVGRWVLTRTEYYRHGSKAPEKHYTASSFVAIDGVWTPQEITVVCNTDHVSNIQLVRVAYNRPIRLGLLEPSALPQLGKILLSTPDPMNAIFSN